MHFFLTFLAHCLCRKEDLHRMPPEETKAKQYKIALETTLEYGLTRYEISNFARNNHESHHNSWYWHGGDFIGLGPGSHSRFHEKNERGCRVASVQVPSPREWLTSVQASGLVMYQGF